MASFTFTFTFVRHHGWYTKAAWTKSRKMKEGPLRILQDPLSPMDLKSQEYSKGSVGFNRS